MFVWCALCITDIKGRSHECTVVVKQIPFSSNKISPYVMLAKSSLLFVHFCRYANRCSNSWTCVVLLYHYKLEWLIRTDFSRKCWSISNVLIPYLNEFLPKSIRQKNNWKFEMYACATESQLARVCLINVRNAPDVIFFLWLLIVLWHW